MKIAIATFGLETAADYFKVSTYMTNKLLSSLLKNQYKLNDNLEVLGCGYYVSPFPNLLAKAISRLFNKKRTKQVNKAIYFT